MLLKTLRDYFLSRPEITAVVQSRIYPVTLPQSEKVPAVDMRIVKGSRDQFLDGISKSGDSVVTIDCYADNDPDEADALAELLIDSGIINFQGTSNFFISGMQIAAGPTHDTEAVEPGSDKWRYVTSFSLRVTWARPCR